MAWSFTGLKYGWKIPTGIVVLGATIYIASNTRHRVNQADVIELVLGTVERCIATQHATQYATNLSYYVSPPNFARSWYSNSYETTNVPGDPTTNWTAVLHTNTFTNVIGWRSDWAMMVELDATIKALVPHFAATNTVYVGSTNVILLTVTSLWAQLKIGDGTNQFTRTPCWTNAAYTNAAEGTNAATTNAATTNVATYGYYPWQIYEQDLVERYKVINALECAVIAICGNYTSTRCGMIVGDGQLGTNTSATWDLAKTRAVPYINSATNYDTEAGGLRGVAWDTTWPFYAGMNCVYGYREESNDYWASASRSQFQIGSFINTNLILKGDVLFENGFSVSGIPLWSGYLDGFLGYGWLVPDSYSTETNFFGNTTVETVAGWVTGTVYGLPQGTMIGENQAPDVGDWGTGPTSLYHNCVSGYQIAGGGRSLLFFNFSYCTNKYW